MFVFPSLVFSYFLRAANSIALRFVSRFRVKLFARLGQPVRFKPPVEVFEPVIACCALLAHARAMTTMFINVELRFVLAALSASYMATIWVPARLSSCAISDKEGRHVFGDRRHVRKRCAVNRSGVAGARVRVSVH